MLLLLSSLALAQTQYWDSVGGVDSAGVGHPVLTVPPAAPSGAEPIGTANQTTVSYSARASYTNGQQSYSTASADFNNDGIPDIISVDRSDGNISCYLTNKNGSLQAPISTAVSSTARFAAVADFNEDGFQDVAVSYNATTVTILFGNGKCQFPTSGTVTVGSGSAARALVAGRLGTSSHFSIISGDSTTTAVNVWLGGGDGGFAAAATYVGPTAGYQLALQDLNGDGYSDLAICGHGDNTVGLLFGTSSQAFGSLQSVSIQGVTPTAIAVGDLNRDGIPDIVINDGSNNSSAPFQRSGNEIFIGQYSSSGNKYKLLAPSTYFPVALGNLGVLQGVSIGDFNGDGIPDIESSVSDFGTTFDGVLIQAGDGFGQFTPLPLFTLSANAPTTGSGGPVIPLYPPVTPPDLNGDGFPDIVVPNAEGAAGIPNLYTLLSSSVTQVTPAVGASFQVTPVPGSLIGSSAGPPVYSAANCTSQYSTYLGSATSRRNITIQAQYDNTPIWVGAPSVVACPGCPFSISDAGFADGGPGALGLEVQPGQTISIDVGLNVTQPGTAGVAGLAPNGIFCIKASGAQDGTFDGGWTSVQELP